MSIIHPDFHLPTKLFVKPDILNETGNILRNLGKRAILITTSDDFEKHENTISKITRAVNDSKINCVIYDEIPQFPNSEYVDSAVYFAKKTNCDIIIGFGSLESINAAKAIALLANNYLFCDDLFSNPEIEKPISLITIPSHPLFGFEILPLFYISDIHDATKKAYWNDFLYPEITIIDPNLAKTANDRQIANYGISTLAISTESIISKSTNAFTDTYALKSIDLIFKNLAKAYKEPFNPAPHSPLAIASILAGVAFSRSYLSICLAIALALSSKTNILIENAIAIMLPHVMEYNLTASPGRYVQMAKVMEEDVSEITVIEAAIKAIEGVRRIEQDLEISQRLSDYSIPKKIFTEVASLTVTYPFLENAARSLNKDEIETILIAAY